jgi:Flp pilus assembly protein TadG
MRTNRFYVKKNSAQAMVEFAIALPVLLLLLYGILEAGRFLFIYSSVVTASRQAVRYGSATGLGTTTVPRFQDCAGIRQAAQRADYLNAFDDEDILIQYDAGPGTPATTYCTGSSVSDTSFNPSSGNTSRLNVTIHGDFNPIVPRIVPFIRRSVDTGNPVRAASARTILVSVSIAVTAPPATWQASTPTNTNTPTFTPTNTPTETPTPTLTPTVVFTSTATRTPTRTITPTITLSPTITSSPTQIPTTVPSCDQVRPGPITRSGNTMSMTVTNPYSFPIMLQDLTVTWNDDKGHQVGGDKTLRLQSVTVGGVTVWTGDIFNQSTYTISTSATIAPGTPPTAVTTTISFTFHQSYDNLDGTENILINFRTPGCENDPISGK